MTDKAGGQIGRALVSWFGRLARGDCERLGGQAAGRRRKANLARERDRKWLHCRGGALQPTSAEAMLGGDRANRAVEQCHAYRAVFRRKAEASRPAFERSHRNQRLRQDIAKRGRCPTCRDHRCRGA